MNAEERTVGPLPNMGRGECLENLESRVRYERVVVNKDGWHGSIQSEPRSTADGRPYETTRFIREV